MAKLIALRSGVNDFMIDAWQSYYSSQLKQEALLFDQIGILTLEQNIISFKNRNTSPVGKKLEAPIAELEWLQENGIIFEPSYFDEGFTDTKLAQYLVSKHKESEKEVWVLIEKARKTRRVDDIADLIDSMIERDSIILRLMCINLDSAEKITAVTMLPFIDYTRKLPNSQRIDVAQLVISKLPLPDNETPWEQIIDYRNDSDNQKNLLNLRRWIRRISTENLSPTETEEELEWLMNEFQNHMKLHKLKANTETLEVIVKAPLEIIEDLIKLKFSKIPEPFFALKKRQINLMEAELNAPGREISYIIKTQEAFQPNE